MPLPLDGLVALIFGLFELLLLLATALLVRCALAGEVLVVLTFPGFERWAPELAEVLWLTAVGDALVRLLYLVSAPVTPLAPPTVVLEGLE